VTLEQNYRSTQPILDVANVVAAQAERVGCINSVRPAEYANLQGESSSRTAVPPRRSHTRRRPPCPREIPLSTQVRKRVRLGQK
jgi:ATP-dependent exoDNAse (exonuclease V) beta subunit